MTPRGLLMLCKLPETLHEERGLAERARGLGLAADVLSPEEAAKLDPNIRMNIAGAVHFPQDCWLTPGRLLQGLTGALVAGGVRFRWGTEVYDATVRAGTVEAVSTSSGPLEAEEIVIACGAWSGRIARSFGLRLPVQAGKGYSITLTSPRRLPRVCSILTEARVAVTPMGSHAPVRRHNGDNGPRCVDR